MDCARGGNPHIRLPKIKIKVEVTAIRDASGAICYSHKINGQNKGGKIDLAKDSGPYKLVFDLDDDTGLGLRFDASAPFYCDVSRGDGCPASIDREQIMVDSCNDDELIVIDWNYGERKELHYQLNVMDEFGERQTPYDPVIVNGGGTKTFNS